MVENIKSEINNQCLSVIMAAYNEISTIEAVIENVISKRLEGIGIELIIGKLKKQNNYRFNDSITNLSIGIVATIHE